MSKCAYCGENVVLPFECSYCHKYFCPQHRFPEEHECPKIPPDPFFWYHKHGKKDKHLESYPVFPYLGKKQELEPAKPRSRKRLTRKIVLPLILLTVITATIIYYPSWYPTAENIGTAIIEQLTEISQTLQYQIKTVSISNIEEGIFQNINLERSERQLPMLINDTTLVAIAKEWATELIQLSELTHGDFTARMTKIGYANRFVCGEIIAYYLGPKLDYAEKFVEMWLKSLPHRDIMLINRNGRMGVSVSRDSQGGYYAVVDFAFE